MLHWTQPKIRQESVKIRHKDGRWRTVVDNKMDLMTQKQRLQANTWVAVLTNHQPCALRLGTAKTTCGLYRAGFKTSRGHAAPDIAAMVQEASRLCQTLSGVGVRLGRKTPEKTEVLGVPPFCECEGDESEKPEERKGRKMKMILS